mmetsp:Transcript_50825/g.109948  ORF Transcript_50825/g.109948 Transcript_50825/m.109948 type:complete len:222 (+) Transcript_50825:1293-1958(+)
MTALPKPKARPFIGAPLASFTQRSSMTLLKLVVTCPSARSARTVRMLRMASDAISPLTEYLPDASAAPAPSIAFMTIAIAATKKGTIAKITRASFQEPMKPRVIPRRRAKPAPAAFPMDKPVIWATKSVCLARVVVRPPGPFLGSSKKPTSWRTKEANAKDRSFMMRPSWRTVKKAYFMNSPMKVPTAQAMKSKLTMFNLSNISSGQSTRLGTTAVPVAAS